jgi:hypothetical protein
VTAIDAIAQVAASQEKSLERILTTLLAPKPPAVPPAGPVGPVGLKARALGMLANFNAAQKAALNPKWNELAYQKFRRFALSSDSNAEILLTLHGDHDGFIDDALLVIEDAEALK